MISVTVESSEFQSLILKTVAFGLCFGRLGWSARAPMSSDHTIHTTPSWTVNVPVMIECVWKNHIGETGHVWTLLHLPRIHFQEWCDAYKIMYCCQRYQLWVLWVWAGLINQFIFMLALRMINVADSSWIVNENTFSPIWMEANSGKSTQSITSQAITLKHNTRTIVECISTKLEWFERRHI